MRYQIENGTVSLGGKTVLDHIDFSVKGREKVAVVGRNGAGKTTLLRLISGELSLDRDDKNFGKGIKTDRELSIGFLHQQSFQDVEKTVEQEIISLINEEDIFSRERYYFEKEYDRIFTGFGFQKEDKKKNEPEQFQALQPDKLPEIKEFSFAEQAPHIERPQNQESQAANLENTVSAKKDTPVEEKEESLPENNNDKILRLHKQGMSSVDIAKELGLGVGEVKLVINLFKGA